MDSVEGALAPSARYCGTVAPIIILHLLSRHTVREKIMGLVQEISMIEDTLTCRSSDRIPELKIILSLG